MIQDIKLLKQSNFNAVRTLLSNHPLCGMNYVIVWYISGWRSEDVEKQFSSQRVAGYRRVMVECVHEMT